MKRALLWFCFSLVLLFVAANVGDQAARRSGGSIAARLLGPVRGVASSVQWVRFDIARIDGDFDLAYARGESALNLNPHSEAGWMLLARHLTFDRGAPDAGLGNADRLVWVKAGLEVLERGKPFVAHPHELELAQATCMAAQASYAAEDCVWPGGAKACFREAARYFLAAGHEELARSALELADESE